MSGIKPSQPEGDWFMPVDLSNSCLLIIDYQNFFAEKKSKGYIADSRNIKPFLKQLTKFFLVNDLAVFATRHFNKEIPSDPFFRFYGRVILKGSFFFKLSKPISQIKGIKARDKSTYSPFYHSVFENELKRKKIKNIYIAGLILEKCVLATAFDAFQRGFNVFVIRECVASKNKKNEKVIFELIEKSCAKVVSLEEVYDF